MRRNLLIGGVGGLAGGLAFGTVMQLTQVPVPRGHGVSMMEMVAMLVGSDQMAVGWAYHLFNSALIGVLFGWLLGSRIQTHASALLWGAIYGTSWWILGALVLMPLILGLPALSPLAASMRPLAVASLGGHLVYGVLTASVFSGLQEKPRSKLRTVA